MLQQRVLDSLQRNKILCSQEAVNDEELWNAVTGDSIDCL